MLWRFNTYVSPNGRSDVQKYIDKANGVLIAAFEVRLEYLQNTHQIDWISPDAKKLKGVKDIYEIRFQANKVQHRPFGYFGPGQGEFTILVWAEEKGRNYRPSNAIQTAAERRAHIAADEASVVPLKIHDEAFSEAQKEGGA